MPSHSSSRRRPPAASGNDAVGDEFSLGGFEVFRRVKIKVLGNPKLPSSLPDQSADALCFV
jgi:hypothetical protein